MCEITKETRDDLRRRFNSGNGTPVERAHLKRFEGLALLDAADREEKLREELEAEIAFYRSRDCQDGTGSAGAKAWIADRLEALLSGDL